jgi:hypothetical protein
LLSTNIEAHEHKGVNFATAVPSTPTLNDRGAVDLAFSRGFEGEWDRYLWGGFANFLIKKENIYYGANTGSGCTLNASARLAVSAYGENFQDVGCELFHGLNTIV